MWFREKALYFIKYVAYLRLMILVHAAVLLASASEIMRYNKEEGGRILSLVIAIILFVLAISLTFIAAFNYFANIKDFNFRFRFFWKQFYAGIRPTKLAALYSTWSL